MIPREGRFMSEYSLNKTQLDDNDIDSIRSICSDLSKDADKIIYDYERSLRDSQMLSDVPDFRSRIDTRNLYVFDVRIDGSEIKFSITSRRFEDWMGYYVIGYDISTGSVTQVTHED